MHSNDTRAATQAKEEVKSALSALEAWEGTWPGARKCKELLLDLMNTANEAVAKVQGQGQRISVENLNGSTSTQPASPISARMERRKSVTIATAPSSSQSSGRAVRTRTRRTQSRDHGTPGRRLSAVSPYRVDSAARARSTSRRRGPDDGENGSSGLSYYQPFSPATTPSGLTASVSQHSSPASNGLPSPTMTTLEQSTESSPSVSNTFPSFNNPISPVAPSSLDYDFAMQPSPLSQSQTSSQPWNSNGNGRDRQAMDIYTTPTMQEPTLFSNSFGYGPMMEGSFSGFDSASDVTLADYIRNYNTAGMSPGGEQDSLWSSYDPGAFGLDPDLPFTISDTLSEVHETTR